jgi:hypothetical protein
MASTEILRAKEMKINEVIFHCPPMFLFFHLNSMGRMSFWRFKIVPNQQILTRQNFDLVMKFKLSHENKNKMASTEILRVKEMKINELCFHCPLMFLFFHLNTVGRMSFWCYEHAPNVQTSMLKKSINLFDEERALC